MPEAFLLSAEDRKAIRSLLEGKVKFPSSDGLSTILGASDIYIAKPISDDEEEENPTIPPLTDKGEDDYDHPGYCKCALYNISPTPDGEEFDWNLVPISNLSIPVYNLGHQEIDNWVIVVKSKSGYWLAVDPDQDKLVMFELSETLLPLGTAEAILTNGETTYVRDTIDIMAPQVDPESVNGNLYLRDNAKSGSWGWAKLSTEKYDTDNYYYDIVSLGGKGNSSSSSTSEEPPSESSESSDSSGIDISSSSSKSSSGSYTPPSNSNPSSNSSNQSSSSLDSSGSSDSSESGSVDVSSDYGSDKSTAIVRSKYSSTGFTALYIAEMPEVRFDDVVIITVPKKEGYIKIDPRYLEVCEDNTIEVCGTSSDLPCLIGAVVEKEQIHIRFDKEEELINIRLVLRLTGVRRGHLGSRFPERTKEQYLKNEAFIRSAY